MGDRTPIFGGKRESLFDPAPVRRTAPSAEEDTDEIACAAFGFLRGQHERALSLELRFKNGNREWLSYGLLASCRFDPSVGLLLKFTADVTTLVLVRGSNLDLPVEPSKVDLIERGLGRHRVTFVREMDKDELLKATELEPTVDRIEVAEFDSQEDLRAFLETAAAAFLHR